VPVMDAKADACACDKLRQISVVLLVILCASEAEVRGRAVTIEPIG
jgi:hypothetical protein